MTWERPFTILVWLKNLPCSATTYLFLYAGRDLVDLYRLQNTGETKKKKAANISPDMLLLKVLKLDLTIHYSGKAACLLTVIPLLQIMEIMQIFIGPNI